MIVTHDWEFLEAGNGVYPISVGMVREDGAELYYEFAQAPWSDIYKHDWLKANVLPILTCTNDGSLVVGEGTETFKSNLAIRGKVFDFLHEASQDSALELWGWYSAYDHVCLGQLFGAMVNLPDFVPMWTNDIKQEVFRRGNPTIPDLREPGELVHHALDDARTEMRMLKWVKNYYPDITNSRGFQYGNGNTQYNTF